MGLFMDGQMDGSYAICSNVTGRTKEEKPFPAATGPSGLFLKNTWRRNSFTLRFSVNFYFMRVRKKSVDLGKNRREYVNGGDCTPERKQSA